MTYRRDLLDLRVVVRSASGRDDSMAAPMRHPTGGLVNTGTVRSPADVVLVKSGLKQVALRIPEVTFVEAARNYVRIHLDGGAVLRSRMPITRLAQHFGTDRFLRVHRGRLVNVDRVRSVAALVGGQLALTLNDGSRVTVARDRRRVVLAELGRTATASATR